LKFAFEGETSEKNTGLLPSKRGITVAALDAGGTAALDPGTAVPAEDVGCTGEDTPGIVADEPPTIAEEAPGTAVPALDKPTFGPTPESELSSPMTGPAGEKPSSFEESPHADRTKLKPIPHSVTFAIDFINTPLN
jgi:hypothetical protein